MKWILLLFAMIFCHIMDDYYLQGILASMKQKSWWKENAPDKMYEYDYIIALFMHSFSWAFMIMLPTTVYALINGIAITEAYATPYVLNTLIHMIVDDSKANKHKINLVQDQCIHLLQIIITWGIVATSWS